MENALYYGGIGNGVNYLNLCRDLSWLNSKNEECTTRDGHVYGYLVDITITSDTTLSLGCFTAPNTWKMRNAFRKWHAYRDGMFKDAGITKREMGRYGRTIRPYLDDDMASGSILRPAADTSQGVWTYTTMASTPGWSDVGVGTESKPIVDTFYLNVCDANVVSTTSAQGVQFYTAAGMIHSYNLDRMEVVTPVDGETVEGPNNPLAMIRFTGAAGGQVMEIAEDQEEEATPYDIADDGDSVDTLVKGLATLSIPTVWDSAEEEQVDQSGFFRTVSIKNVFCPAGLLAISSTASAANTGILITVKGKWECKDF